MAEKQKNDSMVNAQDNDEWVKHETQGQVPVTTVQPPMTPVVIKQEALPYESMPVFIPTPDSLLDQHRRNRQTEIKILLFASSICAYLAFFNVIDFFYMDLQKAAPVDITFVVLKTTVGLFGAIMLPARKFTAIKVYALAFMLVYACFAGFFLQVVFAHQEEMTQKICASQKWFDGGDSLEYSRCLNRAWGMLMGKAAFLAIFAVFGGGIALEYARKTMKFVKSEEERHDEEETEVV